MFAPISFFKIIRVVILNSDQEGKKTKKKQGGELRFLFEDFSFF